MGLPKTFPMKATYGKTTDIPVIGFGTWASGETGWCKDSVLLALKAGYRHLDCAWKYGVDEEIGQAIRESGIPRKEIFVTSKFWPNFAAPENVEKCLDIILERMGLDYLDLYLAHWPVATKPTANIATARAFQNATNDYQAIATGPDGKDVLDLEHCAEDIAASKGAKGSFVPTWKAMQALVQTGKVKAVGVSNFTVSNLKEILPHAQGDDVVPISCNQIEAHPWLPNQELVDFHKANGIVTTVYSPFAGQKEDGQTLIKDETIRQLARKNDMGVGQLLQSWAVQRGTCPLGKSQTEERIKANLDIRELSAEDIHTIDGLAKEGGSGRTIDWSPYWGVPFFP